MCGDLFADLPAQLPEEWIDTLAAGRGMRIERIVSTGQHSPKGFWYDQDQDEWVALLKGEAILEFADRNIRHLKPGMHLLIKAHEKHRVNWTAQDQPTVWLAVFFDAQE